MEEQGKTEHGQVEQKQTTGEPQASVQDCVLQSNAMVSSSSAPKSSKSKIKSKPKPKPKEHAPRQVAPYRCKGPCGQVVYHRPCTLCAAIKAARTTGKEVPEWAREEAKKGKANRITG